MTGQSLRNATWSFQKYLLPEFGTSPTKRSTIVFRRDEERVLKALELKRPAFIPVDINRFRVHCWKELISPIFDPICNVIDQE